MSMHPVLKVRKLIRIKPPRTWSAIGSIGVLLLNIVYFPALAADADRSSAVKIAVFDFELEDVSPAASLLGKTTSNAATMEKVSSEARRVLAQSGRYSLIDVSKVDAKPVTEKSLRNCDGCEAGIALQLSADSNSRGSNRQNPKPAGGEFRRRRRRLGERSPYADQAPGLGERRFQRTAGN
jgi:hypothetical protein